MKKYFYVSILLGAFALFGCTDNKTENQEITEKPLTTEQSLAINNKANTTKIQEVAPIFLNLTQEQKENYYNQYLEILEEIRVEYPSAIMDLTPIDEIEDWIEPEELRERVIDFLKNGVTYYK